jgi:4-amino-4-deoxy-L-arabinose transferase-like glycosyltransferase
MSPLYQIPLQNRLAKWPVFVYRLLLVLTCLPLFWINVTGNHDWGGDFAQYIQQALNMVEGKPQDAGFYLFNPAYPYLAPPAYPVGFPILLAPVAALFGHNILAFTIWITCFLLAAVVLVFEVLRKETEPLVALFIALLLAYHPWLLQFKGEVLSDIPFTCFLTSGLLLWLKAKQQTTNWYLPIAAGLLIGFAILIKNIALVALPVLVILSIVQQLSEASEKPLRTLTFQLITPVIAALACYALAAHILFPTKTDTLGFSSHLLAFEHPKETILHNASYYLDIFQSFFHQMYTPWNALAQFSKILLTAFFILGFVDTLFRKPDLAAILTTAFLGVLFLFPVTTQGLRYLLPILPWMLVLAIRGFNQWQPKAKAATLVILAVILGNQLHQSFVGIGYANHIASTQQGPHSIEAKALFQYLNQTPEEATLVFIKPRTMGLYAKRKCFSNHPETPFPQIQQELETMGWDYLILSKTLPNTALETYVVQMRESLTQVFENEEFQIFMTLNPHQKTRQKS